MRRNIRDLPKPAWLLIGGTFVNRFASFAVVFLVLYLTRHGYSLARAGLVVGVWGVGEVAASLVGGHLADRIGRRRTIALSMFASAAAMVVLSQVRTFAALLPVALVAGTASEMYRPAGAALVADLVPEGARVTAFALLRFSVNLAVAMGAAVAGFLAERSFAAVFLTDAATSVVFGVVALIALPEGRRTSRAEEAERGGYRAALRDRAFTLFLLASVLATFVYFQQQSTLPLHVTRVAELSSADFGLLLAFNGILIVLLELPLSSITMRLPARWMIATGFALVGLGFALTATARSMGALLVTVAIWTLGEMIGAPVSYAYVADLAPDHLRGRYQGLYGLSWATGTVTGPVIGVWLFAQNPTAFWIGCGVVGGLSALLVLAARPRSRPPTAGVSPREMEPVVAQTPGR